MHLLQGSNLHVIPIILLEEQPKDLDKKCLSLYIQLDLSSGSPLKMQPFRPCHCINA